MKKRIAIIGGGIAGVSTAYFLHKQHDITLFEKDNRIGGHAETVDIDYKGTPLAVDTSVMIFNPPSYENFEKLLDTVGIAIEDRPRSNITWGGSFDNRAIEYSNRTLFTQWHNFFSPRMWKMVSEFLRFISMTRNILQIDPGKLEGQTFGEYLRRHKINSDTIDYLIAPLYASIFSLTPEEMLEWPVSLAIEFLDRHRIFASGRNRKTSWHSIRGGTRAYMERLTEPYRDSIRLNTEITRVERGKDKVQITFADGSAEIFDAVVMATHANDALNLLAEPTSAERTLLSSFSYTHNRKFILHNDVSVMPKRKSCWAAFVCNDRLSTLEGGFAITYWLNLIQDIDHRYPLFITINSEDVAEECRFADLYYSHLTFTLESREAQKQLPKLQGVDGIYYCGSYFGYAVHEDALMSAMQVSELLGGSVPWES